MSPALSAAAMRASRSRMKPPTMVSGGGNGPSGSAGTARLRTRTLKKDEASCRSISSSWSSSSSGRMPTIRTSRTRSASAVVLSCSTSAGLAGDLGGVDIDVAEGRPTDHARGDRHVVAPVALLEVDDQDLAGAVLVDRDRLRRAGIGPGRLTSDALAERMPVPEREIVQSGGGDLIVREEHVVRLDDARHAERAVDEAHAPAGAPIVAAGEAGQRAGRHPLGGSDATEDDQVEGSRRRPPAARA